MIDKSKYIKKFLEELHENFSVIEDNLLLLKKHKGGEEYWADFKRALHTVKGSARLMGFKKTEELIHGLENIVVGHREGRFIWNNKLNRLFHLTLNLIRTQAEEIRKSGNEGEYDIGEFTEAIRKAYSGAPYQLPEGMKKKEDDSVDFIVSSDLSDIRNTLQNATIRVSSQIIDDIIYSFNELILKQSQLKRIDLKLNEIQNNLRFDLRAWQNVIESGGTIEEAFRENLRLSRDLKQFEKIQKQFAEQYSILEWESKNFLDSILEMRLMPLSLVLNPLEKFIATEAENLSKEVQAIISNDNIKVDKFIIEKISDPLMHIIRNAVDHGIETKETRLQKGKPETGIIMIQAAIEGGQLIVSIIDDGAGMDLEKIKQKIIEHFPEKEEDLNEMKQGEIISYIFRPGFTTKQEVTSLSGRGVGLDIVRENIEFLKGKIDVISEKDEGTTIQLYIPLSLSMIEGFFVQAGKDKVFLPNNFISEIISLPEKKIFKVLDREAFAYKGETVRIVDINILLQKPNRVPVKKYNQIVILEWLEQYLGLLVNNISEFASLVHKPLPKFTEDINELQGFVYDNNFNIVPILYIPALMERFYKLRDIDRQPHYDSTRKKYKHILLVDNSSASRAIQRDVLMKNEYQIEEAMDGIDALDKLDKTNFNLIITESLMPRMDGLTFVENMRKIRKFKNLPVIMFTSSKKEPKFGQFKELGIKQILIKAHFNRKKYLQTVEEYIL